MAAWKRKGGLQKYYDRFVNGMLVRGYDRTFADGIFQQIQRFSFAMTLARNHACRIARLVNCGTRSARFWSCSPCFKPFGIAVLEAAAS
jgi:hypothetical protein